MTFTLDVRAATPHFPGIGRYVANLAQAMSEQLQPAERLLLMGNPEQAERFAALTGSAVQFVACQPTPFAWAQQWRVPSLLRRVAQPDAQVYHSPYYLMPYRPGAPTVLTHYDLIPLYFPAYVSARARLFYRVALRLALRTAQHVVAISEASRRDLLATFAIAPDRVTTTPLAPEPRFRPQPAAGITDVRTRYALPERFMLYVGINKPHKNLVTLLHAYAQLPDHAPPLVIAGAWDDRYPEARQAAAALDLTARARFLGPVAEADLPALYAAAALFVFPSRYEGFGLPVLEAMACGTPVACSNVSSLPEVAGDAALLFDPSTPAAIAEALEQLLDAPALCAELGARGLAQAARFTWAQTAALTLDIYRQLLHS
ncbi:MAG TPA: glycosyltransferase family 1 protein [Chloroflexi bacterium]|nr:glycosyltransferase family 1 protein [Chloroflexota bacterium]HHW87915.1 glycosyltransferase family 4 protein [Chloroflexota bacterium]